MGKESIAVVGFDLGPSIKVKRGLPNLKVLITHLLLVLEVWNGNQNLGNHGLGIFWCDRISPLAPLSRSNEDCKINSVYILLIHIPRGLQCHTNL